MKVKFFINPRYNARFSNPELGAKDCSYQSKANNQLTIKGCCELLDFHINIQIDISIKEIDNIHNNSYYSFDSVLKSYPQEIVNLLNELIQDLYNRGEWESAWFDFHFEMETRIEEGTSYTDAKYFDFVAYYDNLQAQKSKALLASGFDSIMSVKMKLEEDKQVHESLLPILGSIFNPNT